MKKISLPLACLLACSLGAGISAASDFPEIEGWARQGEPLEFGADDLWEYINGAAEQFLAYGFQLVRACELVAGDVSVTAQIYDMGGPLNAFGIYNVEKSAGTEPRPIGTEAVVYAPYQGLMHKDCFYVKIEAATGNLTDEIATSLLSGIAAALPGEAAPPVELGLLPAEGMVAGSVGYAREGFLGLSDLTDCVYASYGDESEKPYRLFLMLADSEERCQEIWKKLGAKWTPVDHQGLSILTRKIPYKGPVGIVMTEKGLLGVADSEDEAQLLARLMGAIAE